MDGSFFAGSDSAAQPSYNRMESIWAARRRRKERKHRTDNHKLLPPHGSLSVVDPTLSGRIIVFDARGGPHNKAEDSDPLYRIAYRETGLYI